MILLPSHPMAYLHLTALPSPSLGTGTPTPSPMPALPSPSLGAPRGAPSASNSMRVVVGRRSNPAPVFGFQQGQAPAHDQCSLLPPLFQSCPSTIVTHQARPFAVCIARRCTATRAKLICCCRSSSHRGKSATGSNVCVVRLATTHPSRPFPARPVHRQETVLRIPARPKGWIGCGRRLCRFHSTAGCSVCLPCRHGSTRRHFRRPVAHVTPSLAFHPQSRVLRRGLVAKGKEKAQLLDTLINACIAELVVCLLFS